MKIIDILPLTFKVKIRNRIETIGKWEEKVKKYETNSQSCKCIGFGFHQWCNHQGYLEWRDNLLQIESKNNNSKTLNAFFSDLETFKGDGVKLSEKYGENLINELKKIGEIFEVSGIIKKV